MLCALWLSLGVRTPVQAIVLDDTPPHEALIRSGDEHRDTNDDLAAIEDYEQAYELMPLQTRVGAHGQYVVAEAARAYQRLHKESPDLARLRACEAFLSRHIDELDSARTGTAPVEPNEWESYIRESLTTVRAGIDEMNAAVLPEPEPEPEPELVPESEPISEPVPEEQAPASGAPRRRPDALALSMFAVGSVVTLGGAALLVDGLLFPSMIEEARARQRRIDEMEGDLLPGEPDPPSYVAHENKMRRNGIALVVTGSCSIAAGLALVTWGQLRLRRRSGKSAALLQISPHLGLRAAGVTTKVRF